MDHPIVATSPVPGTIAQPAVERIRSLIGSLNDDDERTSLLVALDALDAEAGEARRRGEQIVRIYERITDAFFALDREWRFVYMNPVAHRMRVTTPWEDIVGKSLWEVFPDLEGTAFDTEYHRAMAEGIPVQVEEYFARTGRWFEAIAYPSEEGLSVFFRDVTERKITEEALAESHRRLEEAFRREHEAARKLREVDEMKRSFLTAISHELRTPLAAIVGYAETLLHRDQLPDETRREFLGRIAAKSQALNTMVADLLDVDRLARGTIEPLRSRVDLGALVRRIVDTDGVTAGRIVRVDADGVVGDVDVALVERIVENLLTNAIRHTPDGTPVWVSFSAADDGAIIAVDDAGPGVPDDLKARVFEPFSTGVTAPGRTAGVGIGLTLVSRFAALHGGRAWVQDRPEGGCSFRVHLPGSSNGATKPPVDPEREPTV